MKYGKVIVGGLVAQNRSSIENSYTVLQIKGGGKLAGGFCAENSAEIQTSYSSSALNSLNGGFTGADEGRTQTHCYFLHSEKEGSKKLQRLSDSAKAQRLSEIKSNDDAAALGFDTENIWVYRGDEIPLGFIPEKWLHEADAAPHEPILIETADDLTQWAEKVNQGDKAAIRAHVQLKADLDLGGREWTPIGESRVSAFCGVFDGGGHTVKNFVINDKNRENKGFFGFLKGELYNLSVDCTIKNGNCIGALVAQNDGGTIGCCSAVVEITAMLGIVGGLVGINNGSIFQSYSAGKISAFAIPLWWGFPVLALVLLLLLTTGSNSILPVFAPVPYDKDQIPIEDDTEIPNTDGNFVSFQFEQEIDVALNTGLCSFQFKNPGNSNHNIVVQLQFTDAQAIRVMGSTGRSQREQEALEANPGYDPENYRTVIAESGAIHPGYQLTDLRLVSHANGATLPEGTYNAMIYLVFYDVETNNRAMLESQLPVVIEVKPFV